MSRSWRDSCPCAGACEGGALVAAAGAGPGRAFSSLISSACLSTVSLRALIASTTGFGVSVTAVTLVDLSPCSAWKNSSDNLRHSLIVWGRSGVRYRLSSTLFITVWNRSSAKSSWSGAAIAGYPNLVSLEISIPSSCIVTPDTFRSELRRSRACL